MDEITIGFLLSHGLTYHDVSNFYQNFFPGQRGFSSRSIRRFCRSHQVTRLSHIDDSELDNIVRLATINLGISYGRRTLQGYLRSRGVLVSQYRISTSLRRVSPQASLQRRNFAHIRLNPHPYVCNFYGEKLHIDQNEKLIRYGITHVGAIDGYSRKIVGFITIPIKNPIVIYDRLFRPLLLTEGIWQQLRTDHGSEFVLIADVQKKLAQYRQTQSHHSVLQTSSRLNHRIERLWVEINQRVNYPVKRILISMEAKSEVDLGNEMHKFCISYATMKVIEPAISNFIDSWNNHRIPGVNGGIPNDLARNNVGLTTVPHAYIPSTYSALSNYEGRLSRPSYFGIDPLREFPLLQTLRNKDFDEMTPSHFEVFRDVVQAHSSGVLLRNHIKKFIELTERFSALQ